MTRKSCSRDYLFGSAIDGHMLAPPYWLSVSIPPRPDKRMSCISNNETDFCFSAVFISSFLHLLHLSLPSLALSVSFLTER